MENGLFDIPDLDSLEDESFPPLPPPHSPGQGGREAGEPSDNEDGDASQLVDVPAAKRKGAKRPQPKLDSQRLISERGLPALRTLFDNVRFKGKGHEAEDLRLLMQKMENWAHRLYPKLQFEDFIDKVEKLGNKKDVQTCLKRIRLDMPLTHEDFMVGEEEAAAAAPESHVFGDPDPFNSSSFSNLPAPVHSTPGAPVHSTLGAPASPPAPSLTEEQRRRMELNRQRALERRLARQQPTDSQTVASSADEPTDVLNNSKDRDEEEEEEEEEEPASSTQQQQQQQQQEEEPSQLPHTDSEPPAESPRSEREEEPGLSEVQDPGLGEVQDPGLGEVQEPGLGEVQDSGLSNECEDGD
ncbi:TIMELESS-interacting protein [Cebidichthys violaceus]|uniref:TIMELESS-interacting protein n=1 Tax=Cebidichthys violaceus TaxID=271503 RepID=UPI0035CABAE6